MAAQDAWVVDVDGGGKSSCLIALVLVDLLRREGDFDQAELWRKRALCAGYDSPVQPILDYQWQLIQRCDDAEHTMADVVAE